MTNVGTIKNDSCSFNPVTGNLNWRQNNKYEGLKETFNYDNLDRLDNVYKGTGTPVMTLDMAYESEKGGITWKSDVGTLIYEYPDKPYAVSGIDTSGVGLVIPEYAQEISYTSFESVSDISENGIVAEFIYNSDNERAKMEVKQGGNTILVRWYLSGSFIKETTDSVTKEFTFIGGDSYTAPVVAITQSDTTRYYYILRDYLGNITHIVNSSNNEVVAEYSFDAWGRMRDPSTWINYAPGSEPSLFVAGRGYTGHEHLPWFNIINMNGRIYDPLTGMFLSPDNYVQSPTSTQSYNRYAYCWNNPLKYSDPTGEKLKWWHWLLGDLFTGGLISSTAAITATQISVDLLTYHATATITVQSIKSVLVPLDYTVQFCNTLFSNDYYAANSRFQNAIKIDFGLFQTDPNLSGGDRVWQLISRFTWEHLQTELGRTYTHARNMVGDVDRVDYFGGATFATKENYTNKYGFPSSNGISIGNYINISIGDEIAGDCESYVISNPLYMHEYGHTFDSRSFGMSYLFFVGLPSLISAGSAEQVTDEISGVSTHDFKWYEMNANKHAAYYFGKYYGVDWYTRFLRGTFETYYPRKKRK